MLKRLAEIKTVTWLGLVAAIAILERTLLYIFYPPVTYHDTGSYLRLAQTILHGWKDYDGTRTPGYPLFLSVFGPDSQNIYLAQLAIGLLTSLLFFYIGWRVTGQGWCGALAALLHTLNAQQLLFEANLLTETLTIFFIAVAMTGLAWLFFSDGKQPVILALLAALVVGLSSGAAALIRPLYIFLPLWAGFFLVLFWRVRPLVRWGTALTAGLSAVLILFAWMNFVHQRWGNWDLTTMSGYQLTQHTGPFFELVPNKYAAIRDTFIKYRDAEIAATGSPADAIWAAIPELQKVSGLGFIPLSNLLAEICTRLILDHPFLYLRSVFQGWLWFWKAPIIWAPAQIANPLLQSIGKGLVLAERGGIFLCNLLFIAGSLALLWQRARQVLKPNLFLVYASSVIWITSILQSLLDHSDNLRQSVPVTTMLILVVVWWAGQVVDGWKSRNPRSPANPR